MEFDDFNKKFSPARAPGCDDDLNGDAKRIMGFIRREGMMTAPVVANRMHLKGDDGLERVMRAIHQMYSDGKVEPVMRRKYQGKNVYAWKAVA